MARTILLADDSPTIRKIVELTFAGSEFRVVAVENGSEALRRIESDMPVLLLADVVMPPPNGYELCRSVKRSSRPIPVLLLAGTFEPFDRARAGECGADAHLVKPFESSVLHEKVRALLAEPSAVTVPEASEVAANDGPDDDVQRALDEAERAAEVVEPGAPQAEPRPVDPAPRSERSATAPPPEWVEAVADAVIERLSRDVLREVAWEVVPQLAREIIRERIRELETEDPSRD